MRDCTAEHARKSRFRGLGAKRPSPSHSHDTRRAPWPKEAEKSRKTTPSARCRSRPKRIPRLGTAYGVSLGWGFGTVISEGFPVMQPDTRSDSHLILATSIKIKPEFKARLNSSHESRSPSELTSIPDEKAVGGRGLARGTSRSPGRVRNRSAKRQIGASQPVGANTVDNTKQGPSKTRLSAMPTEKSVSEIGFSPFVTNVVSSRQASNAGHQTRRRRLQFDVNKEIGRLFEEESPTHYDLIWPPDRLFCVRPLLGDTIDIDPSSRRQLVLRAARSSARTASRPPTSSASARPSHAEPAPAYRKPALSEIGRIIEIPLSSIRSQGYSQSYRKQLLLFLIVLS